MYLFRLAMASLANRRFTAILTAFAIALSVCLLLAVERVRVEARNSFASTISGTDLIVGARSGSVNLLLYSVFRIGNATNNIRWDSYEHFAANPQVKWAIPISLGDSHRGYRVMGTNEAYFEHYQYGRKQNLELASGRAFATRSKWCWVLKSPTPCITSSAISWCWPTVWQWSAWSNTMTNRSPWSAFSSAPARR